MYTAISDHLFIVFSLIEKNEKVSKGKAVNSLIQVNEPQNNEFGTIIPSALYYRRQEKELKVKSYDYQEYYDIVRIYLFVRKSKDFIYVIPLYDVCIIDFSEIPSERQVDFLKEIKKIEIGDTLLHAFLVSFMNKSMLIKNTEVLWKRKRDIIEHTFYTAGLDAELDSKYSIDLCMITNDLPKKLNKSLKTMLLTIAIKASENLFKEKLFSDIDTWDFFHKYSLKAPYRHIVNFLFYSKCRILAYFLLIPASVLIIAEGVSIVVHDLINFTYYIITKYKANHFINFLSHYIHLGILSFLHTAPRGWLFQTITLTYTTLIALFFVLDAYLVKGSIREEAKKINRIFLSDPYYNFGIPINDLKIYIKKKIKHKMYKLYKYYNISSVIEYYTTLIEIKTFGKSNRKSEIVKSLIERFLPNYIISRNNALLNSLWR